MSEHSMATLRTLQPGSRFAGFGGNLRCAFIRAVDIVLAWQERSCQRHALASLDDCMLKDLGLGHADAMRESNKPFWRN